MSGRVHDPRRRSVCEHGRCSAGASVIRGGSQSKQPLLTGVARPGICCGRCSQYPRRRRDSPQSLLTISSVGRQPGDERFPTLGSLSRRYASLADPVDAYSGHDRCYEHSWTQKEDDAASGPKTARANLCEGYSNGKAIDRGRRSVCHHHLSRS